jgi:hypothetical protein
MSVITPARLHNRAYKNTVSIPLITKFHQSQFPAIPFFATNPVTASWRVGGKRGRDHRCARKPPRHITAREKELGRAASCSSCVVDADAEIEQEISRDNRPIEKR